MRDQLLELTFPSIKFGATETPWNLAILLYKGGADARLDESERLIASGALGDPDLDRLPLLSSLHEEISAALGIGGSRETVSVQFRCLRSFVGFADRTGSSLTLERVTETYCAWADWLFHRVRLKTAMPASAGGPTKSLTMRSAYHYGATVGMLIDCVLDRRTNVLELTRLRWQSQRKTAIGVQAEKQSLNNTFAFGHVLQDICDGLTLETVREAPLPVEIKMRSGIIIARKGDNGWHARMEGSDLGERYPLANLRIEAELLMFIGQTGINLAQAVRLDLRHFAYVSHLDGYQVKDRKERRGGSVLFEVFKDYRGHFERYLEWRRVLFPEDKRLFPFIGLDGSRPEKRFGGHRLRSVCAELNVQFVPPRALRKTRVNWLLRMSSDPELTAEMAQHTKQTLLAVYERPSLQRAMVESMRFWSKFDPHSGRTQSVAPGGCTGTPQAVEDAPKEAAQPDCIKLSGCLWCENHRDVDSLDHIWSLASFCHLKRLELSRVNPVESNGVPPAKHAIDRIVAKLRWFEQSSDLRRGWVTEAEIRISEGDYHSSFNDAIAALEGTA